MRSRTLAFVLAAGCAGGGTGQSTGPPPTSVSIGEVGSDSASSDTGSSSTSTSTTSDVSSGVDSSSSGPIEGCGNMIIEVGEECDDANEDLCDGCESCVRRSIMFLDGANGTQLQVTDTPTQPLELVPPFTIEGWFRLDGANEDLPIIKRADGNIGYRLGVAANQIAGSVFSGFDHIASNLPIVGTGWHHVAWTYDGATSTLYLDGILAGEEAHVEVPTATMTPLLIGSWIGGDGQFVESRSGRVDEVRISNVVRYPGPFEPVRRHDSDVSTILLLHLDASDTALPIDASPNAHVLAVSGVAWEPDNGYGVPAFCE